MDMATVDLAAGSGLIDESGRVYSTTVASSILSHGSGYCEIMNIAAIGLRN